jgi:hypothetical protein
MLGRSASRPNSNSNSNKIFRGAHAFFFCSTKRIGRNLKDVRAYLFYIISSSRELEIKMKSALLVATALAALATTAYAKPAKKTPAPPADRYYDSAHGPNDPHSLWLAGDYIGRDPDPAILAAMKRQPYN